MRIACASLSMTQGPAIRNRGASPPKRIFPAEKVRGVSIYAIAQVARGNRLCGFVILFNFELHLTSESTAETQSSPRKKGHGCKRD